MVGELLQAPQPPLAVTADPKRIYRQRHKIENFFCRIKDWRRLATRFDKLARNFLGIPTRKHQGAICSLALGIGTWLVYFPQISSWGEHFPGQLAGLIAAFIGSDNFEGGKLAGEFIVKALGGKGSVAILEGIPGHETGDSRLRGFHSVVDGQTGLKIVASQPANWERDQGFNVFQNILQSHPDLKAVFACSDLMALGAVEAIRAAKRDNIIVVGFDAFSEAQDAVKAGTMHATIAQSPSTMGALAVENALHALRGEPLQENIQVNIKLVTKENAS